MKKARFSQKRAFLLGGGTPLAARIERRPGAHPLSGKRLKFRVSACSRMSPGEAPTLWAW
jgi:hypothetical protein